MNKNNSVFSKEAIDAYRKTEKIGENLIFMEETVSTNADAKAYAAQHNSDAVFVAAGQSGGRGRMQRSFSSPKGMGIYLSALLHLKLEAKDVSAVTPLAAVAVAEAIEALTGALPKVKWINDVYLNGKKVCGILTEGGVTDGKIGYLIIGIGLNLYQRPEDFSEELRIRASSVLQETGISVSRSEMTAEILYRLERLLIKEGYPKNKASVLKQYRQRLLYLGEEIRVIGAKESYLATAVDIDENGCLLVKTADGSLQTVNSGEISIRPAK